MPEMTIEAAIIELNRLKAQERMDIDRDRLTAAIVVCENAMRKQIPQVPLVTGEDEQDWVICPQCADLICTVSAATFWNEEPSYCENCGQALDWKRR